MATAIKPILDKNQNPFTSLGKDFLNTLRLTVINVLVDRGVKQRSDLVQSVEFDPSKSRDSLYMYVNDYYESLSKGRKPKMRKIPIQAILSWLKKYSITSTRGYSQTRLAFVIQNSIYKQGIRGKNFINEVENSVSDVVELNVADYLEDAIADSLLTTFTIK